MPILRVPRAPNCWLLLLHTPGPTTGHIVPFPSSSGHTYLSRSCYSIPHRALFTDLPERLQDQLLMELTSRGTIQLAQVMHCTIAQNAHANIHIEAFRRRHTYTSSNRVFAQISTEEMLAHYVKAELAKRKAVREWAIATLVCVLLWTNRPSCNWRRHTDFTTCTPLPGGEVCRKVQFQH